jgi:hypothetical protein
MKEEPIHECHVISHSKYADHKIGSTVRFPTSIGIPIELWLNENGVVIGINYYREKDPEEKVNEC